MQLRFFFFFFPIFLNIDRLFFCLYLQQEKRIFTNFHRQVFCWTDKWYGMTMDDIRRLEDETKDELDEVNYLIYNDLYCIMQISFIFYVQDCIFILFLIIFSSSKVIKRLRQILATLNSKPQRRQQETITLSTVMPILKY